jgi:4'-phosphopantetheinyl transferase
LWLVDLEKCAKPLDALERAVPRLSADDMDRAGVIDDIRERRHRLAAYTALRVLLERVAGTSVRGERFVRTAGGKPRLPSGSPEFSLSHIDGLALIGISSGLPIGVDLERLRTVHMAPRRISEIIAIGSGLSDRALPAGGLDRTFIQAWSRLEAFCKARGRGLAQTLTDVGVRSKSTPLLSPGEVESRARELAKTAHIAVADLYLHPGVHGAVGTARGVSFERVRPFPTDRAGIDRLASGEI